MNLENPHNRHTPPAALEKKQIPESKDMNGRNPDLNFFVKQSWGILCLTENWQHADENSPPELSPGTRATVQRLLKENVPLTLEVIQEITDRIARELKYTHETLTSPQMAAIQRGDIDETIRLGWEKLCNRPEMLSSLAAPDSPPELQPQTRARIEAQINELKQAKESGQAGDIQLMDLFMTTAGSIAEALRHADDLRETKT